MTTEGASQSQPTVTPGLSRNVPVFLFAYANDRTDDRRFLRNLAEERRRIKLALRGAGDQGRCKIVECTGATLSEVLDECQRNARSLSLLHFAGHADTLSLFFETAGGTPHTVNAALLSQFLSSIKGLQLVFLNGCSTQGQVESLLACGVKAVIATSTSVADEVATELAERFYKAVVTGAAIKDAFHQATGAVIATFGKNVSDQAHLEGAHRDICHEKINGNLEQPFPWALFGDPDALAHQLITSRRTDSARCRIVIVATLEEFDSATIARVTAELQRITDDLSLKITKLEAGSVRLYIDLSLEGSRRLLDYWQSGTLTTLCEFRVSGIDLIDDQDTTTSEERFKHLIANFYFPAHNSATTASLAPRPALFAEPEPLGFASGSQADLIATNGGVSPPISENAQISVRTSGSMEVRSRKARPRVRPLYFVLGCLAITSMLIVLAVVLTTEAKDNPSERTAAADSEFDRKLADERKARDAAHIAAVEAALRDRNLRKARSELEQVWPDSLVYQKIKRKYDNAVLQAINDLAARLDRAITPDCAEYNQILAEERGLQLTAVITEATHQSPCTPAARDQCDVKALASEAAALHKAGKLTAAFVTYDKAWYCKSDPLVAKQGFVVACLMSSVQKARLFWKRLPADAKRSMAAYCANNEITQQQLDAP